MGLLSKQSAGCPLTCPLWGDGQGYVPDAIVDGAPVLVLAQNPGADEERGMKVVGKVGRDNVCDPTPPQPLIGATGYWWERHLLPLTGLTRSQISCANVIRCRWEARNKRGKLEKTNKLPPAAILWEAARVCMATHFRVPQGVSLGLVVACGKLAHDWARGGSTVSEAAGSLGRWDRQGIPPDPGTPVLSVLHPADLFADTSQILPSKADWRRVGQFLRGEWPRPLPLPTHDWVTWGLAASSDSYVVCDTEYYYDKNELPTALQLLGLYTPKAGALQIPWLKDGHYVLPAWQREQVSQWWESFLTTYGGRWVFHNALADVPVLKMTFGAVPAWGQVEDTLLAHSVRHAEIGHDL